MFIWHIIATIKMRNIFFYPCKNGLFSIAPHLVVALPTLRQQQLSLLIAFLQFLYDFCSCCPLTLLKALEKSNGYLFAITFKSEKERQLQRVSYQIRSKELIPKQDANIRLRVITLQGAIEKSQILLSQYWKNE